MSAQIIQFPPRQSAGLVRMYSEDQKIINAALCNAHERAIYESSLGFIPYVDTAPSEYCAPPDDCA